MSRIETTMNRIAHLHVVGLSATNPLGNAAESSKPNLLFILFDDLGYGESKDVADANPEVVERLTTLMRDYIAEGRSTPGARQKNEATLSVDKLSTGKKTKVRKAQTE